MKKNVLSDFNLLSIPRLRDELTRRKVAVFNVAEDVWQPIPVALTPTRIDATAWSNIEKDSRLILGTFPRVMSWILRMSKRQSYAADFLERMLGDFSPDESRLARLDPFQNWGHVTTRFDLFWHQGLLKIIEANCTIPAMHAYSDNVLEAWLVAGGRAPQQPRNVDQLLRSLIIMYRYHGGSSVHPRIAILHREGDSQLGELQWLCGRWNALGIPSVLVTPQNLSRVGEFWAAGDMNCEIVYRHIFASKLDNSQVLRGLSEPSKYHIYNPVSAHYECKAFFSVLSFVASDEEAARDVGLSLEETRAIEYRIPWSRVIGGEMAAVSEDSIERRLEGLVLKKSVGYGGHQILIGDAWFSDENQSRLKKIMSTTAVVDLRSFLRWIRSERSLWVAQERLSGVCRETPVLTSQGVQRWNAWFDASIFLDSTGFNICRGGSSRMAEKPIVNIGTGGGLAPLVIDGDD